MKGFTLTKHGRKRLQQRVGNIENPKDHLYKVMRKGTDVPANDGFAKKYVGNKYIFKETGSNYKLITVWQCESDNIPENIYKEYIK